MKRSLFSCALVGLSLVGVLYTQAGADQLYIRNRPFKGVMKRNGGRIWVDLKTFAEALGATVEQTAEGGTVVRMPGSSAPETPVAAGKLMVGDQEAESEAGDNGSLLVPLEATAKLLGARVSPNKSLGTIDVSLVQPSAKSGDSPVAPVAPVAAATQGPIIRPINKAGSAVDVSGQLVAGRINIIDFYADW